MMRLSGSLAGAALLTLWLAGCVDAPDRHAAIDPEDLEGGIIGTGIIGTVTGMGSVHVNGMRVMFDKSTMVRTPMGPEPAVDLAPGDTVVIEAQKENAGTEKGGLRATSISRYTPLVGQVEEIAGDGSLQVLGARVIGLEGASAASLVAGDATSGLTTTDWIEVSGVWRNGDLIASRIRRLPPQPKALAQGDLALGPDGALRVGGVRLSHNPPALMSALGEAVEVSLGADDAAPLSWRVGLFSAPVRRLFVEGYLGPMERDGRYRVFGAGPPLAMAKDAPMEDMPEGRGLFCAMRNGSLKLHGLLALPTDSADRIAKLEAMARETHGDGCEM